MPADAPLHGIRIIECSALGPALGACIIGMAFEGVIYANLDSSWDFTFLGAVLFIAVVVNRVFYRRALKARR